MGVYVFQNEQLDKVAGLGYSVVDSAISSSSENPVQNKVVKEYVDTSANAKVSKDQGVAQSGKVLGINASGMVEPVDVAGSASDITYDNSTSGLTATDVQEAIDEVDSTVDGLATTVGGQGSQISTLIADTAKCYKTTDSADTTLVDADYVPFYDTSASAKKKITWANIVTKMKSSLASYFGRKFSQASGVLKLLANDDTELSSVTLSPLASNTSYTDTNSIGATNVQSAINKLTEYSEGDVTVNSTYLSGYGNWQKIGKLVSVYYEVNVIADLPSSDWTVKLITGLPSFHTKSSGAKKFTAVANNDATKRPVIFAGTGASGYDNTCLYSWGNGGVTSGGTYKGSFEYFTF